MKRIICADETCSGAECWCYWHHCASADVGDDCACVRARACVRVMVLLLIRLKGASGCLSLSSAISVLKYGGGKRKRGSGRVSMCQC